MTSLGDAEAATAATAKGAAGGEEAASQGIIRSDGREASSSAPPTQHHVAEGDDGATPILPAAATAAAATETDEHGQLQNQSNGLLPCNEAADVLMVFGGPYSNLQATLAVRAEAERLGLRRDQVVCTGDVCAYCGNPAETTAALVEWGIDVVKGNCEESLGEQRADCGCGFEEGSVCDYLSGAWFAFASRNLGAEHREWMRSRPERLDRRVGAFAVSFVHATPRRNSEFVFASADDEELGARIDEADNANNADKASPCAEDEDATGGRRPAAVDVLIAGHSGIPFTRVLRDGRVWHNAGVVGTPANDGTPRAWYSLLTPVTRTLLKIEHRALAYDYEAAAAAMERASLPCGYREALVTGLWPSLDVLPEAERRATGVALDPGAVVVAHRTAAPRGCDVGAE